MPTNSREGCCSGPPSRWPCSPSPELLILDEPTTALDATTQALVLDLLRELASRIDSTHRPRDPQPGRGRAGVRPSGGDVRGPSAGAGAHGQASSRSPSIPTPQTCSPVRPASERPRVPGRPPSPGCLLVWTTYPRGCTFAPRCPLNQPYCWTADPPARRGGGRPLQRVSALGDPEERAPDDWPAVSLGRRAPAAPAPRASAARADARTS